MNLELEGKIVVVRGAPNIRVNGSSSGSCDTLMGRGALKGATPDYVKGLLL